MQALKTVAFRHSLLLDAQLQALNDRVFSLVQIEYKDFFDWKALLLQV